MQSLDMYFASHSLFGMTLAGAEKVIIAFFDRDEIELNGPARIYLDVVQIGRLDLAVRGLDFSGCNGLKESLRNKVVFLCAVILYLQFIGHVFPETHVGRYKLILCESYAYCLHLGPVSGLDPLGCILDIVGTCEGGSPEKQKGSPCEKNSLTHRSLLCVG